VCGETFRLFNCRRCRGQVRICSPCDRGHLYCATCAPICRLEARRRASARHQRTPRGARCHAARQKAYRARCAQKVTDTGCAKGAALATVPATSAATVSCDAILTLDPEPEPPASVAEISDRLDRAIEWCCDFCRRALPRFARLQTLRGWGFG
jgi:hypothetical protein